VKGLKHGDDIGYVTFGASMIPCSSMFRWSDTERPVLFPRHFQNADVAASTISHIQLFRDYLHYHIKCSKAYMHSRMRHRVGEFQRVLNRAKTEVATTDKKTIRFVKYTCFLNTAVDNAPYPTQREDIGIAVIPYVCYAYATLYLTMCIIPSMA
jgi:hypothetical protein